MGEGLHHGSLCGIPKKPTSGRGVQVITGIRGVHSHGGTVEMRRNQRQAVVSVVCTGGTAGRIEYAPQGLIICQIQYSGRTISMRVIHGSHRGDVCISMRVIHGSHRGICVSL